MNRELASEIAVSGLAFLANDPNQLARFLKLTGINPAELRQVAGSREFLSGVLEYFLADEPTLLEFSVANQLEPEMIRNAHGALAAPAAPDWDN